MNGTRVKLGLLALAAGIVIPLVVKSYQSFDTYTCDREPIRAEVGDDYWGYLEQHCKGNLQNAADDVVEFYGEILMPGKMIYLPSSDKCDLQLNTMEDGNEYVYEVCQE